MYKGMELFTNQNQKVIINEVCGEYIKLLYKNKIYTRKIADVIGITLFESDKRVRIGSKVTVLDLKKDRIENYKILKNNRYTRRLPSDVSLPVYGRSGAIEQRIVIDKDFKKGEISDESVLGEALLGKVEGEVFSYITPKGNVSSIKIISIT